MLDAQLRAAVAPVLDRLSRPLSVRGVAPGSVTAVGLLVGVGACVAVAARAGGVGLGLWLLNRMLDGVDGPLARLDGSSQPGVGTKLAGASELGGLLDFVADFVVYSGFVVAVSVAHPAARLACVVLLATYLINNVALLSFSSMIERLKLDFGDERSLRFTSGLAEGAETIVVYVLFCVLPGASTTIAWAFAGLVGVTAVQRVVQAIGVLRTIPPPG